MKRFTRVFPMTASLLAGALLSACTEVATAPSSPTFAVAPSDYEVPSEFTKCKPQQYVFAAGWIGPKGGLLRAGNHRLWVPAGALSELTWITMETPTGSLNRVVFGPEGLTFNERYPAQLETSYETCTVAPGVSQAIAYVNQSLRIMELTASEDKRSSQSVTAKLLHFSEYVLLSTYAVVY